MGHEAPTSAVKNEIKEEPAATASGPIVKRDLAPPSDDGSVGTPVKKTRTLTALI